MDQAPPREAAQAASTPPWEAKAPTPPWEASAQTPPWEVRASIQEAHPVQTIDKPDLVVGYKDTTAAQDYLSSSRAYNYMGRTREDPDYKSLSPAAQKLVDEKLGLSVDTSPLGTFGRSLRNSAPVAMDFAAGAGAANALVATYIDPLLPGQDGIEIGIKIGTHALASLAGGIAGVTIGQKVNNVPQDSEEQQREDLENPWSQRAGNFVGQMLFGGGRLGLQPGSVARKVAGVAVPAALGGTIQAVNEHLAGNQPGSGSRIAESAAMAGLLSGKPGGIGAILMGEGGGSIAEKAETAGSTKNAKNATQDANAELILPQQALPGPKPQNAIETPVQAQLPSPAKAQAELAPQPRDSRINPDIRIDDPRTTAPIPDKRTPTQAQIESTLGIDKADSGIPTETRRFEIENAFKAADKAKEVADQHVHGGFSFGSDKLPSPSIPPKEGSIAGTVGDHDEIGGAGKVATELNPDAPKASKPPFGRSVVNPNKSGSFGIFPGVRTGTIADPLLGYLGGKLAGNLTGQDQETKDRWARNGLALGALVGTAGQYPGEILSAVRDLKDIPTDEHLKTAAESQRGVPETTMLKVVGNLQKAGAPAAMNNLLEHVGDLAHRLQEPRFMGGAAGGKIKMLNNILYPRDFGSSKSMTIEQEIEHGLQGNAEYRTLQNHPEIDNDPKLKSWEKYAAVEKQFPDEIAKNKQAAKDAMAAELPKYVKAHQDENKPITYAGELGKKAAIQLGKMDFDGLRKTAAELTDFYNKNAGKPSIYARGNGDTGKQQDLFGKNGTSGGINPALVYHLGAPVVGATIGSQFGSTPEEKRKNAILGALIASGGSLASHALINVKANNPEMWDRLKYEGYKFMQGGPANAEDVLNARDNLKKPQNAVQVKSTNGIPVRPTSGNGEGVGQQNTESEGPPAARQVKQPKLREYENAVSQEVRDTKEYKDSVTESIQDIYGRAQKSRSVDPEAKRQMDNELLHGTGFTPEEIDNLKTNELPVTALEGLRQKMAFLEWAGRKQVADRAQLHENEKAQLVAAMASEPSNPMNESVTPNRATVNYGIGQRIDNFFSDLSKKTNGLYRGWLGHNQVDVVVDHAGGDQHGKGALFTTFIGRQDSDHTVRSNLMDDWKKPLAAIVQKNNLSPTDIERVNMYGLSKTKGGIAHLLDSNLEPDAIARLNRYVKGGETLTPGQMEYYKAARKILDDEIFPRVQAVARNVHDIDVQKVPDYWPIQRDYEHYIAPPDNPELAVENNAGFDQMNSLRKLMDDYTNARTTRTEQGFTKERIEGAKGPAYLGAELLDRHIGDAAHLIAFAKDLKMLGEITRHPWFGQKYGNLFQQYMLTHLDSLARDGDPLGTVRMNWANRLARNSAASVLGIRISQLKHATNAGFAIQHIGINRFTDGLREGLNPDSRAWVARNAPEVSQRFGGEQSIMDLSGGTGLADKARKVSFAPERAIDQAVSFGSFIGAYKNELKAQGIDPNSWRNIPVNEQARNRALYLTRKVVTSPLLKDAPLAISTGFGSPFGKDAGMRKLFYQFQSTMLRQTSNFYHDLVDLGIKKGNYGYATATAIAFLGAMAADMWVNRRAKDATEAFANVGKVGLPDIKDGGTTKPPDSEEPYAQQIFDPTKIDTKGLGQDVVSEVLRRVPVLGPVASGAMYSDRSSYFPAISTVGQGLYSGIKAVKGIASGKSLNDPSIKRSLSDVVVGANTAFFGIPGVGTAANIYNDSLKSENPRRDSLMPVLRTPTTGQGRR